MVASNEGAAVVRLANLQVGTSASVRGVPRVACAASPSLTSGESRPWKAGRRRPRLAVHSTKRSFGSRMSLWEPEEPDEPELEPDDLDPAA